MVTALLGHVPDVSIASVMHYYETFVDDQAGAIPPERQHRKYWDHWTREMENLQKDRQRRAALKSSDSANP